MRGHARLVLRVCCVAGFATWCAAGFAAARAPKDPRKGVIQQLFGTSLPGAKLFSPSISKQKEMAKGYLQDLNWRLLLLKSRKI